MKLFAFGDSFTYGLVKENTRTKVKSYIEIIGDMLGIEVLNKARPGSGNAEIASNLSNSLLMSEIEEDDFVFVGWSGLTRPFAWDKSQSGYSNKMQFPIKTSHGFIKEPETEECVNMSALSMRYTSDVLTKRNIKHLMISNFVDHKTFLFDLQKDEEWSDWIEYNRYNNTVYDICAGTWLDETPDLTASVLKNHNDTGFTNQYIAGCQHPTQAGHNLIAQTLFKYFDEVMHA